MNQPSSAYKTMAGDQGDASTQIMMEQLPQVYYIARRIYERLPRHVPFEDLVHEGVVGLIEASRKYDPKKNVKFKSYAQFRIRGAILDSLREWDWSPRPLRQKGKTISEATTKLASELGRQPEHDEIANELGIELTELQNLLTRLGGLEVVNQQHESTFDSGDTQDIIESAPSDGRDNPFELFANAELREHVARAAKHLTEKEQMVLSLFYVEELTMKEIAQVLEVGESRISQLHTAAIGKLRKRLQHLVPEMANAQGD